MMDSSTTAPLWTYGLAALAYAAFLVQQWRQPREAAPTVAERALWAVAVATIAWAGATLLALLLEGGGALLAAQVLDVLRYGSWYVLLIVLLRTARAQTATASPIQARWPIGVGGLLVGAATVLQLWSALSGLEAVQRLAHYALLALAIFGLVLVEQLYRNTTDDSRWQIKPLAIALIAAFGFDLYAHSLTVLFGRLDDDAFSVRGFAHALVLPLVLLTLYRGRKRPLRITLSQSAAFQTTSLLFAGGYLLLAAAAGYYVRYLGGSWGGALQIALLFAASLLLLVLMLSGSLRARLKVLIGKHFFRYRYDYREEWLKFTRTLSTGESAQQVGLQVIRGLADMVESPAGSLWLKDGDRQEFAQFARWNMPVCEARESAEGALVRFLEKSGWVINLEEYRHRPSRYQNLELPLWLTHTANAWLVVPLALPSGIVGFVVLATARAPVDINWEVNDLLRTAGRQAASFLAQIQATEALLEARKFEAFNKMSAFVVHDLKNIVTQLSLLLKNAERHANNPEFQRDMLETVGHAVERMKQLMMQLREGSRPSSSGRVGVDLEAVARRIQKAKAPQQPAVELTVRSPVFARADEARIERVIGHLVQNALEATPANGRVWIDIGREGSQAVIEVGDTGRGMSEEFIRERLFKPFHTTKHSGMGIGAYESRQYIQELGGDIRVESKENVGTRFVITLPLIEVSKTSDLKTPDAA